MKKTTKLLTFLLLCTFAAVTLLSSCKKEEDDAHTPPKIAFKTGTNYVSADATINKDSTITVGITCDKTEDELSRLNVSYAYDGASSTTTKDNFDLTAAQEDHFEKDYTIKARSVAGSEKWTFTMTDKDGNNKSVSLTLTVK